MLLVVEALAGIVLLALVVVTACAVGNRRRIRRFDAYPVATSLPRVSVLVPARDELENIEPCLRHLLAQGHRDLEVLVLDDHSRDGTHEAALAVARDDARVRVLRGAPLPEGWLGKHWACHQLAEAASGELILFVDADTRLQPDALATSVSALLAEEADLVTALPGEQVRTWGERLVVPALVIGLACAPVALVERFRLAPLAFTVGQFMLFRRHAYDGVGGHAAVRDRVVDDVELGRRIVRSGRRWRLLDGTGHVTCRMYGGFAEAAAGIGKVLPAVFGHRVLPYAGAIAACALLFLYPPAALIGTVLAGGSLLVSPAPLGLAGVATTALLWAIAYRRVGYPYRWVATYPLVVLALVGVAAWSGIAAARGRAVWRDRRLPPRRWRWR